MNLLLKCAFVAASSLLLAQSASAVVLFTDNYDANSNQSPNDQITNAGRQGGTLATLGYIQSGNVQIGNTGTLPANTASGSALGDEFLAAFGGIAYVNHDFSNVTLPLEITYRGIISSLAGGATDDWSAVMIGSSAGQFVNGGNVSSVLMRANGATELWNHGSSAAGGTGSATGLDVWSDYKVVVSDTAGTGSAFNGNGSRIDYYVNGVQLGTFTSSQLNAGDGYIGFSANRINGYDNLQIATVPEPTGAVLLTSLGLLTLSRKRRA